MRKNKKLTKKAAFEMIKNDYTMFYRPMPEAFKELFPVVTISILSDMGLHFTDKHTGKMVGMESLSTTCKCNDDCKNKIRIALAKAGNDELTKKAAKKMLADFLKEDPYRTDLMICAFCFSDAQQDYQKSMTDPLIRNYVILNNGIIHSDWLPVLNDLYFRGESFDDFASVNAVVNFFNLAKKNKLINITAWTKNPTYFKKAIEAGHVKPDNFKLILSSLFINKQTKVSKTYADIIDAVFTVYTPQYAKKHNITINCGARACLACLRCYSGFDGSVKIVNELLK